MALTSPFSSAAASIAGGGSDIDKDDVLGLLNDESDDKVPDKPEKEDTETDKEVKPDKDEEDKEEKDDKDEIELKDTDEEDEDKINLKEPDDEIVIGVPPKKKELEAAYPGILKKFPFLEKMLFRDKAYNELFGSFDDAKEAAERAEQLNGFEKQLLSGNTEEILKSVKEADKKAFNKIVDEYLPTLNKIDNQAYLHVVGNVIKHTIIKMVQESKRTENEDLKAAASILNQFAFASSEFVPPERLSVESDKTNEVEAERAAFMQERLDTAVSDLQTKADNVLRNTINEYIDPKSAMTPYVKRNAINDALRLVNKAIVSDTAFRKQLDKLWEASHRDKFSRNSLDKIRSAYLGKAKLLLPSAIKQARSEALKDAVPQRKVSEEEKEDSGSSRRGPIPTGRSAASQSGKKLEMEKGESVTDFFMRD